MKIFNAIFSNFWAKIFSLALAVVTWFYIFDVVSSEFFAQKKEALEDVLSEHAFAVKEVPVKVNFTGQSPEGYRVILKNVVVDPSKVTIFAPEEVLAGVNELRTDRIDIGEYTRSASVRTGLHADVKTLDMTSKIVDVYIPVVKDKEESVRKKIEVTPREKPEAVSNKEKIEEKVEENIEVKSETVPEAVSAAAGNEN